MENFADSYRAVVVGATGGLGAAFTRHLAADPRCVGVHALSRSGRGEAGDKVVPGRVDILDEESVAAAAGAVGESGTPAFVIVSTGYLHGPDAGPEKSWSHITADGLARNFAINTTGPALVAKHFLPLMPRKERGVFAALSARVGSISDNGIGGWYGYRASKAALNQVLKCLAIEGARKRPGLVVAGLQPGTVRTGLSEPFRGHVRAEDLFEPDTAAGHLLGVLDRLGPEQSGRVFDWAGSEVPP